MAASMEMQQTSPPRAGKKRNRIGVIEGGPVWSIPLGGINFPVHTIRQNQQGAEIPSLGAVAYLDEQDKARVMTSLKNKVVRWVKRRETGQTIRADVYDKDTIGFVSEAEDEPLAKYVYMDEEPEPITTTLQTVADKTLAQKLEAEALESAKKSEEIKALDPKDAKTREVHGKLKKIGGPAPTAAETGDL